MKFKLEEYNRNVPEEELLSDLRMVSKKLNKESLRTSEYNEYGRFSISLFQRRFGSWIKALEKANLLTERKNTKLDKEKVIADIKLVATKLNKNSITAFEYSQHGKFSPSGVSSIFGSWNSTLKAVGLNIRKISKITDEELFRNLEEVWINLGRQPKYGEIEKPMSKYSGGTYERRFGTWRKSLEAFIEYINSDKEENQEIEETIIEEKAIVKEEEFKHKTKRNPSDRLKVLVLMRDGNKCALCGITVIGKDIHFDHKKAWSLGGETTLENLQILCAPHNLAKSNLEYPDK